MTIPRLLRETPGKRVSLSELVEDQKQSDLKSLAINACENDSWQVFFEELKKIYQIESISTDVEEFIQESLLIDLLEGPAGIRGCTQYFRQVFSFQKPYLINFPAFGIDSDTWLLLTNGRVITLHHDNDFHETVSDAETDCDNRNDFLEKLSSLGSIFSLTEYLRLNYLLARKDYGSEWYSSDIEQNKVLLNAVREVKGLDYEELDKLVFGERAASFIYSAAAAFLEGIEDEEWTMSEI